MPSEAPQKNPFKRHSIVVLALLTLPALVMPARAGDTNREFVPEVNAFFKLSDETRLFLLGDQTRNQTENTTQNEVGAHLDITLKQVMDKCGVATGTEKGTAREIKEWQAIMDHLRALPVKKKGELPVISIDERAAEVRAIKA